jgi:chromosome condensin MukBEF ATPase and DNA-binding subunit MukB
LVHTPDGGIGDADHLRDVIRAADDGNDRPERFLAHQLAIVRHLVDHGRRIKRALPVVAVQQHGALLDRIDDAALE